MTNMEIAYMVAILTLMSTEHFKECVDYVAKTNMSPEERYFMERIIYVAKTKRQKIVTAT